MMAILLEMNQNSKAWCIDTTGKVYDVYVHPYGANDTDAIEDAAWLYLNNFPISAKDSYISYIADKFIEDFEINSELDLKLSYADIIESLKEIESIQQYSGLDALIQLVLKEVKNKILSNDIDSKNLDTAEHAIKQILNNNFIRVRYGSEYQTTVDNPGALYFRISSNNNFNWYDVIMKFTLKIMDKYRIGSITIETDHATTGRRVIYYDHVPIDEFILNKEIVMEACKKHLLAI